MFQTRSFSTSDVARKCPSAEKARVCTDPVSRRKTSLPVAVSNNPMASISGWKGSTPDLRTPAARSRASEENVVGRPRSPDIMAKERAVNVSVICSPLLLQTVTSAPLGLKQELKLVRDALPPSGLARDM